MVKSCAFIDNTLVSYDSEDKRIKAIKEFDKSKGIIPETTSSIITSNRGNLSALSSWNIN